MRASIMLNFDIHYCLSAWDLSCSICGGRFYSQKLEGSNKYVLYCCRCLVSTLSTMMIKLLDHKVCDNVWFPYISAQFFLPVLGLYFQSSCGLDSAGWIVLHAVDPENEAIRSKSHKRQWGHPLSHVDRLTYRGLEEIFMILANTVYNFISKVRDNQMWRCNYVNSLRFDVGASFAFCLRYSERLLVLYRGHHDPWSSSGGLGVPL
jgi:hypothetical protein